MKISDVLKKHGYQLDNGLAPVGLKGYGRGSTGGPDPRWRLIVIVKTNGEWRHVDALGQQLQHGQGPIELEGHLAYFHRKDNGGTRKKAA